MWTWTTGQLVFLIFFAGILVFVGWRALIGLWRSQGTRVLTCPENLETVAVKVDRWRAVEDSVFCSQSWALNDCTRWPERAGCGQMCVAEIEKAPGNCLLKTILTSWYENRQCEICGKPFGELHWHDNKPGLIDPQGATHEWTEIKPEAVRDALNSHRPVCWDCMVANEFRRKFPELVTDRNFADHDTPGIWKN